MKKITFRTGELEGVTLQAVADGSWCVEDKINHIENAGHIYQTGGGRWGVRTKNANQRPRVEVTYKTRYTAILALLNRAYKQGARARLTRKVLADRGAL